ncbi:RDD family protein [Methanobrevibacter olleyae]|uniref:RDD family protein n=1 Tax=Methanobrevibacter olleyae TaxID=294671 RepID=A0A1I4KQF1_METOL|nr:RDD family protein [Methanobrevibacter olleyae]SFL81022.1 RDD family protein [Methanobrevibacter olleyae]
MDLFLKRVVAYILDFFVVSAFMWIISYFAYFFINYLNMFQIYHYFVFILPILILTYFTILEKNLGATVGKRLMFIEVKTTIPKRERTGRDYSITYSQGLIRSISKIYWFPIIFDVILGKFTGKTRLLDGITRTTVIEEDRDVFFENK